MPDRFVDITFFGTSLINANAAELGLELDDQRGRQGNVAFSSKLFPSTSGGGGQTAVITTIAYRPGNRYKFVRANGTITNNEACVYDVTFATAIERSANVIQSANVANGTPLAGIAEAPFSVGGASGSGTFAAGNYFFLTVRGLVIAECSTATAGDVLLPTATAGHLTPITATTPTAAEVIQAQRMAAGVGSRAMSALNTPITGMAYVVLT